MDRPTKEMIAAGEQIASDLIDAHIAKAFGKMGHDNRPPISSYANSDLIQEYVDDKISSVEAIYIAMERANPLVVTREYQ